MARTGELIYGPGETPIDVGPDGMTRIMREPSEVFAPDAIRSAEGKPVVNEHPDRDVTPEDWKDKVLGHVMNVRRGEGPESDLLLGDLLIADKSAIDLIESGKRELSCGYSADYDETGPGRGKQRNIIINHVALVEQGRCGPRCSIGDRKAQERALTTKKNAFQRWLDQVRGKAFIGDQQAAMEMLKEGPMRETADGDEKHMKHHDTGGHHGSEHHTHIHLGHRGHHGRDDDEEEHGAGERHGEHAHSIEARVAKLEESMRGVAEAVSKIVGMMEHAGGKGGEHDDDDDDDDDDNEGETESVTEEMHDSGGRRHHKRHRKGRDDDGAEEGDKEIEGKLEEEAPPGSEGKAGKARDSAYLADSFKQTVALAEILAPGIRIPTFDRAAKPVAGYRTICALRRQALDLAYQTADGRGYIEAVTGGRFSVKDAGCSKIRTVFLAAAGMKSGANNGSFSARSSIEGLDISGAAPSGIGSIAELQALFDTHNSKNS